ncbi:MAG: glycosyltransferase, partial [Pseudomonadota bacterium]|nr:glycosyltransferase [Pseudomonadota bacterium]
MPRRHIAIFTLMGNGHLYPLLPLCAELTRRGYRVSCPANAHYSPQVRASGAEVIPFTDIPVDPALRKENAQRSSSHADDGGRFTTTQLEWQHFVCSNDAFLTQVEPCYALNVPDLILYSRYCLPARLIAHRLRRPAVQLSPHFAYSGRSRFWDRGVHTNPPELVEYAHKVDSFLAGHGLPGTDHLWHIEALNVHLLPRPFQYRDELFDDRFVFASSPLHRSFQPLWHAPRNGKPVVLISGYSGLPETWVLDTRYFHTIIAALAEIDCHCVLSISDQVPTAALGALPDNFEITRTASHLEILPRAALLICHAGMGSTLEAIYHGVPVLAVPASPYTEEVGYRAAQLGVGKLLPRDSLSVDSVRSSVQQMLLDPELSERTES